MKSGRFLSETESISANRRQIRSDLVFSLSLGISDICFVDELPVANCRLVAYINEDFVPDVDQRQWLRTTISCIKTYTLPRADNSFVRNELIFSKTTPEHPPTKIANI